MAKVKGEEKGALSHYSGQNYYGRGKGRWYLRLESSQSERGGGGSERDNGFK